MSADIMKFDGYHEFTVRTYRSGENDNDDVMLAYKLYFQDNNVKFTLEHVWRLLKDDQKWTSWAASKSQPRKKKSKLNNGSAVDSSSNTEAASSERPMGVKAAKAKAKRSNKAETSSADVDELESLWLIKQKDFTFEDKLSKQSLLESLVARGDGLSDEEVLLKKSLISHIITNL